MGKVEASAHVYRASDTLEMFGLNENRPQRPTFISTDGPARDAARRDTPDPSTKTLDAGLQPSTTIAATNGTLKRVLAAVACSPNRGLTC